MNKLKNRLAKLEARTSPISSHFTTFNGMRMCVAKGDPVTLWTWAIRGPAGQTINEFRESIGLTRLDVPGCDEPRDVTEGKKNL